MSIPMVFSIIFQNLAAIEVASKALVFSELSDKGRETCDWERDFSEYERCSYRGKAAIVVMALMEHQKEREAGAIRLEELSNNPM